MSKFNTIIGFVFFALSVLANIVSWNEDDKLLSAEYGTRSVLLFAVACIFWLHADVLERKNNSK